MVEQIKVFFSLRVHSSLKLSPDSLLPFLLLPDSLLCGIDNVSNDQVCTITTAWVFIMTLAAEDNGYCYMTAIDWISLLIITDHY